MSDTTSPEYEAVTAANAISDGSAMISSSNDVVFSDYSAYSPLIAWLLLVSPATTLGCTLLVWLDPDEPPSEHDFAIRILLCTTVGLLVLYLLILPYRISVFSNGSVGVRVLCFATYTFSNVVRAYHSPGMWDDSCRARIKFATNLDKRVVVMRRKGKWDLTVSPGDVQGFLDAVSGVTKAMADNQEARTSRTSLPEIV